VSLTERQVRRIVLPPLDESARQVMRDDVLAAHRRLVDAIVSGNADLAAHRMHRHLSAMEPFLV
jgi:DNA-binding FadR family transcriptional regulator